MAVNIKGKQGESLKGKNGDNGILFTPTISNGELSWTNNGGLPNPANSGVGTKAQIEAGIGSHERYQGAHFYILKLISDKLPPPLPPPLPPTTYDPMLTVMRVHMKDSDLTMRLSYLESIEGEGKIQINWGDGTSSAVDRSTPSAPIQHLYSLSGFYIITIKNCARLRVTNHVDFHVTDMVQCSVELAYSRGMFDGCIGLRSVSNFTFPAYDALYDTVFRQCINLKTIKASANLPRTVLGCDSTFEDCVALSCDIKDLLPIGGFDFKRHPSLIRTFKGCKKLNGVVPAEDYWKNTAWNRFAHDDCFKDCTGLTNYNDIPKSWGGPHEEYA